MNGIDVKIEGVDQALEILESYPVNAHKVIDKAIRKAGTVAIREVRQGVPKPGWRKLAKGRLKSYKDGASFFKFGLFQKEMKLGKGEIHPWFKAYWYNNGTMANRDPNHHFDYPRKKATAQRKGGIRPRNFFEPSAERGMERFKDVFQQELEKQTTEIYKAHATARTTSQDI